MDDLRQKIIKACQKAPDNAELKKFLLSVLGRDEQPRFDEKPTTLQEAATQMMKKTDLGLCIRLEDRIFDNLMDYFFLTAGLHVIAGPSGSGKTLWAMEWAKQAAKDGHKVLFLSLEMSSKEIAARTLTEYTDYNLKTFMKNDLGDAARLAIDDLVHQERMDWMSRILIDHIGDYDYNKVKATLWDRMMKYQPKLVILDYVQMLSTSEKNANQSKVLGDVARDLKLFAERTQSAVLLLSQFNRDCFRDMRTNIIEKYGFIPLSNQFVKESGGIVEAADSTQLVCIPQRIQAAPTSLDGLFQVTVD